MQATRRSSGIATGLTALALLACVACGSDGPKRVFLTSTKHTGNLGGIAGGYAKCQATADAAVAEGLLDADGAEWTAWLSDANNDAITLLPDGGPWVLVDGTVVFNDKAHVALNPAQVHTVINLDERGNKTTFTATSDPIWTGTGPGGLKHAETCASWTTASNVQMGHYGQPDLFKNNEWTSKASGHCELLFRLLCFQK